MPSEPPFFRFGPESPISPVILSVPHGGRFYPPGFETIARLPAERLRGLEDRYADRLIERAVAAGSSAIVANTARAWVDLNRSEREFDPAMVIGGQTLGPVASAKVRGGLGVVPRRLIREGELWRGPLSTAHFVDRLHRHHRPYHRALGELVDSAISSFGVAVVLDIHSMPPLAVLSCGTPGPQLVVGDLFGRAAASRFAQAAISALGEAGQKVALNSPYAGGHILERHGQPQRGVHALQIEIDRSLYLDNLLDKPAPGLAAVQAKIARLAALLADEARSAALPLAAE